MHQHVGADWRPGINPCSITNLYAYAAMRSVEASKVACWTPIIAVNGEVPIKVIHPRHVWLHIVGTSHCLATVLGINGKVP